MSRKLLGITLLKIIMSIFPLIAMEGYYKDLFMDGGVYLYHHTELPAAESLSLEMEYLATSSSIIQTSVMIQNEADENGVLLYPDGEPRFRCIYTNGGSATNHGNSLGEEGRNRVRKFFRNGGGYTGSCAGAFISSLSYQTSGVWEAYYHIWPGRTASTGLSETSTGHFVVPGSPLLTYFDFGGDLYIDGVFHNGGCYARETIDWPPQTEILLRFDYPGWTMHEKVSCWAYKASDTTGRVTVIGSHPEGILSGEQLHLMEAILLYSMEGGGIPSVKAQLNRGEIRVMDRSTSDSLPQYTRIGDKQYHHFTVQVPLEASELHIILDGSEGFDFNLYLNPGDFAFNSSAEYSDTHYGSDKTIYLESVPPGLWYIGVELATTVDTLQQIWGTEYSGATEVLDGIEYTISVDWETTITISDNMKYVNNYSLFPNFPNPFNDRTDVHFYLPEQTQVRLEVLNSSGQRVNSLCESSLAAGIHRYPWDGKDNDGEFLPSGVYFIKLITPDKAFSKKALLIR
ncbi:T9SS type A sorting domain-containing protein [bacterium]|nr:T9SS type A sorting domain-containing protein [bacterium]